ncbi:hypothetical protein B0H17DRAFT_1091212, partial [Mycena rosella]
MCHAPCGRESVRSARQLICSSLLLFLAPEILGFHASCGRSRQELSPACVSYIMQLWVDAGGHFWQGQPGSARLHAALHFFFLVRRT